eukprot:6702459-Prymnesium_polylepis.1
MSSEPLPCPGVPACRRRATRKPSRSIARATLRGCRSAVAAPIEALAVGVPEVLNADAMGSCP